MRATVMGETFWQVLTWSDANHLGDLSGILGVFISLIGFLITIIGVYKSQGAAERAEKAAKSTRESIQLLNSVVDFSAAISILEEIKRLHRREDWLLLPDRYASIRKLLISLRSSGPRLSDEQSTVIQTALANLRSIEEQVERAMRT
jgi:hypothetical protein